jgi:hypothetical protein
VAAIPVAAVYVVPPLAILVVVAIVPTIVSAALTALVAAVLAVSVFMVRLATDVGLLMRTRPFAASPICAVRARVNDVARPPRR